MKRPNANKSRIANSIKPGCRILLLCLTLTCVTPQISMGYDNDTHFWLTYYLALKAGYTSAQATQIASANVSVDFDKDTEPLMPGFDSWKDWFQPLSHYQYIRGRFHALPPSSSVFNDEWWNPTKREVNDEGRAKLEQIVRARKDEFWKETLQEQENPGVFLHYLQDTFAHDGFTSYVGHAGYYYVDFLDSDKDKAEKMAFQTLNYLIVFREALLTQKTFENLRDPESFNSEDLVSPEIILQVKRTVEEFRQANPSLGIRPNILVEDWDNLDENGKLKYKTPPKIYGCSILHIINNGPAPDSRNARTVVQRVLNIEESQLPHIWLYDLDSLGSPKKRYAQKALVYIPYKTTKRVFTAEDEKANTKSQDIYVNSRKQCLLFALDRGNSQVDPFNCK